MSKSRSFDRAADIYDQTRLLFEPIAKQGIQAILDQIRPATRLLDVGTGTGRISVPLLEQGVDLIGCDISPRMLARLKEKFPTARLARADAASLPFPDAQFDAVLTVHVLHLIPAWREALREFRRVLVAGGTYLNVKTEAPDEVSIRQQFHTHWKDWLAVQGVSTDPIGLNDQVEFVQELKSLGAHLTEMEILRYPLAFTLRAELERLASRVNSLTWDIPDPVFDASIQDLRAWVQREYGDLDQARQDQVRFLIDVARFE